MSVVDDPCFFFVQPDIFLFRSPFKKKHKKQDRTCKQTSGEESVVKVYHVTTKWRRNGKMKNKDEGMGMPFINRTTSEVRPSPDQLYSSCTVGQLDRRNQTCFVRSWNLLTTFQVPLVMDPVCSWIDRPYLDAR